MARSRCIRPQITVTAEQLFLLRYGKAVSQYRLPCPAHSALVWKRKIGPGPEPHTPLQLFAGLGREEPTKGCPRTLDPWFEARTDASEGCTRGTTLTRLAALADLSREERERCVSHAQKTARKALPPFFA
jgi:hypothetical protein